MEKLWTKENFKCDRYCGECCKKLIVRVSREDIKKIKKLGYKEEEFLEKDIFYSNKTNLKKNKEGCIFLKKNKDGKYTCKIRNDRPKTCREYPFFPNIPKEIKSCLPQDLYPNVFFSIPAISNNKQ